MKRQTIVIRTAGGSSYELELFGETYKGKKTGRGGKIEPVSVHMGTQSVQRLKIGESFGYHSDIGRRNYKSAPIKSIDFKPYL